MLRLFFLAHLPPRALPSTSRFSPWPSPVILHASKYASFHFFTSPDASIDSHSPRRAETLSIRSHRLASPST
ncbi:hypothetical protein C8R44DRAFT_761902 [Mycena epipterygia]|nr:hypothetical protein C8R44DRAFT_761902 [Mycena epipterygia]